jgi:hypothetical protein
MKWPFLGRPCPSSPFSSSSRAWPAFLTASKISFSATCSVAVTPSCIFSISTAACSAILLGSLHKGSRSGCQGFVNRCKDVKNRCKGFVNRCRALEKGVKLRIRVRKLNNRCQTSGGGSSLGVASFEGNLQATFHRIFIVGRTQLRARAALLSTLLRHRRSCTDRGSGKRFT